MPASLSVLQSGVPPLHEVRKRKEKMTPINLKAKRIHRGVSWNYFAGDCIAGLRSYYFFLDVPVARFVRGKKR